MSCVLIFVFLIAKFASAAEKEGDTAIDLNINCHVALAHFSPAKYCLDSSCECAVCEKGGQTYCIDAENDSAGFTCPPIDKEEYDKCLEARRIARIFLIIVGSIGCVCISSLMLFLWVKCCGKPKEPITYL